MKRRRRLGVEKLESRRLLAACGPYNAYGTPGDPINLGELSGTTHLENCPALPVGGRARYYEFKLSQNASAGHAAIASFNATFTDSIIGMGLNDQNNSKLIENGMLTSIDGTVIGKQRKINFFPLVKANQTYQLALYNTNSGAIQPSFNLTIFAPGATTAPTPSQTPGSTPSQTTAPTTSQAPTSLSFLDLLFLDALFSDPTPPSTPALTLDGPPPQNDAAEIEIRTDGVEISDGDDGLKSADLREFGTIPIRSTVTKTFTIHNNGGMELKLTGDPLVEVTEERKAFRIVTLPDKSVMPGGETSFQVEFTPTERPGNYATGIRIESNDSDESTYRFGLTGSAVAQEIEIRGNGLEIDDGDDSPGPADQTEFGTVPVGSAVTRTFTIHNTGGTDLALIGDPLIEMLGNESLAFRIIERPDDKVMAKGETKFQVEFTPASSGEHRVKIRIKNDDLDESIYSFDIRGSAPAASSISGRVFHDENRNGNVDPDETGMAGVTLYLDTNNNGTLDELEPEVETGADGSYAFTELAGGRYTVRQVVPNDMIQSTPASVVEEDLYYVFRFFKDKNADRIATVSPDGTVNPDIGLTHSDPDGETVHGLAYDSRDGILYGTKGVTNELFEFDLQTGEGTLLGTLPADIGSGLTYNPIDDRLYTFQRGNLIRIDPATLTTEVVNAAGANVMTASVVYNPVDGLIYAHSTDDPRMQIFNAVNGNGPFIAHDPVDFEKSYAAAHNGEDFVFAKADDTGDFVTYDRLSGSSSIVLSPDLELRNSANGMAFAPAATSGGAWQVILAPGQSVTNRNFSQSDIAAAQAPENVPENAPEIAPESATIASPSWQNRNEVTDVNNDSVTSAVDALIIINELSQLQFSPNNSELPQRTDQDEFFHDVNGDGFVSAVDALMVINFLSSKEGEGESIREPMDVINRPDSTNGLAISKTTGRTVNLLPLDHDRGMTRPADNSFRNSQTTSIATVDLHDSEDNISSPLEDILSDIADDLATRWH